MKNNSYIKTLLTVIFFGAMISISGCKKDDEPSATDKVKKQLVSGLWKINKVAIDGVEKTSEFTGLTIQFQNSSLTTSNGNLIWLPNDTWTFTNNDAKAFIRGDGVQVTITSISDTKLSLSLTWDKTTFGGGRVSSVSGNYTFEFVK